MIYCSRLYLGLTWLDVPGHPLKVVSREGQLDGDLLGGGAVGAAAAARLRAAAVAEVQVVQVVGAVPAAMARTIKS